MNCIIIDDEPLAIKVIEKHLSLIEGFAVIDTFNSALPVYTFLQKNKVDLIFLDIEMPNLTGLNFIKSLKKQPQVIVTTAHREYALESYDYIIADYLLKPISFDRLLKAISKLEKSSLDNQNPITNVATNDNDPFAFFRIDRRNQKINLKDILYIESIKNHVKIVLPNITHITLMNLQEVAYKIDEKSFIRVHKSFIVAKDKIQSFNNKNLEVHNRSIPIGRTYKLKVQEALNKHMF